MLLRAITRVAVLEGQRAARATGIKGPRERSHASKSHVVIMLVEDNVMREEDTEVVLEVDGSVQLPRHKVESGEIAR